jgi:O-antigen/teichoic acid export membrane protein
MSDSLRGNSLENGIRKIRFAKRSINLLSMLTLRKGWFTLANQGVVSATNFLTGVLIGRFCTKEEFGLYMLGYSIVFFVMDIQTSLISTPYMVYSPRLKGDSLRLYNGSSLIHQLALSAIVMLSLVSSGVVLSFGFGPSGLIPVVWALVITISFITFREFVRRFCFAGLRMGIALLFDFCVAVIQICGLFLLAKFGFLSATCAYWVVGIACGVVGGGWFLLNRASFKIQIHQSISDLIHNWTFGKWVFASGILWAISMNLYPWFLTLFHGTASAGVWGVCLGVLSLLNVPLTGVQNFLGPKIANVYTVDGVEALRRFVFKACLVLGLVMGFLSFGLFFIAGPLLVLIYGDKYSGYGLVVSILAFGMVAASIAFAFSRALFAMERSDVDFKVNFIPLFILLTCGVWLVRSFGPIGAAFGLLLANMAATAVRFASFAYISRSFSSKKILSRT